MILVIISAGWERVVPSVAGPRLTIEEQLDAADVTQLEYG